FAVPSSSFTAQSARSDEDTCSRNTAELVRKTSHVTTPPNTAQIITRSGIERLSMVSLQPLQPTGHIGSGGTELLAKAGAKPFELTCNFRLYVYLRGSRNAAQQNRREPKQDKGSDQHGNQQ